VLWLNSWFIRRATEPIGRRPAEVEA
jgi:hypothetical protein